MINYIDLNKKSDFIYEQFSEINTQRIVSIILPFLALHSKTAAVSSAFVGCYQCYTLWQDSTGKISLGYKWTHGALLVSSTALGYFFPFHQLILSNGVFFTSHIYQLITADTRYDKSTTLLQMTHQTLHLSSLYYRTPAWIVLSLLSQATSELIQAYHQYQSSKKPEMTASLLLAALRLYKAHTYLPVFQRQKREPLPAQEAHSADTSPAPEQIESNPISINTALATTPSAEEQILATLSLSPLQEEENRLKPAISLQEQPLPKSLKQLTQKEWDKLSFTYQIQATNLDFSSALAKDGFSSEIEGIHFTYQYGRLERVDFHDLTFKNCKFDKLILDGSKFQRVIATNCSFRKSNWKNGLILNSIFKECDFSLSTFHQTEIKETIINQSNLTAAIWCNNILKNLLIQQSVLSEINLLETKVEESKLIDCDLTNALLLDTKDHFTITGGAPHQLTKPVVALGWNFIHPGTFACLIRKALIDNGALVLFYDQKNEDHFNHLIQSEVQTEFKKMESIEESCAIQLLSNAPASSEIAKVKERASLILRHCQGLVVPGGEDIEKCFYQLSNRIECSDRTLVELALLAEAQRQKIPTMGVCRGAQLINVYFGGTLHDVSNQHEKHDLEWTSSPHRQELQNFIGQSMKGLSLHDQAVHQVGKGLHVILERENVPKFLISEDGNFIASQFHAEYYIDKIKNLKKATQNLLIDRMDNISKELEILKNLFSEFKEQIQKNYSENLLVRNLVEQVTSNGFKKIKKIDFIISNKKIYQFFMNKVEAFRTQTSFKIERVR